MARFRPRSRGDEGFSLLESVIALAIAAVVFTALASAMVSSMKAVLVGRSVQQAGDVGTQALEEMRTLGYDSLAMVSADLSVSEPLAIASTGTYDPIRNAASGPDEEDLVLDPNGAVNPHVEVRNVNSTAYTLRKYVTRPEEAIDAAAKRITVVASWSQRGEARTRTFSTLVTETRRGLPLPDYKWANNGATAGCVSPGGQIVYGFTLTNNGARDSWTFSNAGSGLVWEMYDDSGSGSEASFGVDDAKITTGVTGSIDPTEIRYFWAVANPSASATEGVTTDTFTVTSVAQPTYFQSVTTTTSVAATCTTLPTATATGTSTATATPTATSTSVPPPTPVVCTNGTTGTASSSGSITPTSYYLRNGATNLGDTTALNPRPLTYLAAGDSTTLWNYATDLSGSTSGRYLAPSGTTTATTAEWRYQFGSATQLINNGVLTLWAAPASGSSSDALQFTATVYRLTSSGTVDKTISPAAVPAVSTAWGCTGFKKFGVVIDFSGGQGTKFTANQYIAVKVTVAGAPALLAYDTTTFPSELVLPVKSGGS